jgi:integrase/recombinase XerD
VKIARHGQAKILTPEEITHLFDGAIHLGLLRMCLLLKAHAIAAWMSPALQSARDRALFGVCLYTGCRINEACSLMSADVYGSDGTVRPRITLRKGSTKGKRGTRSIPTNPKLTKLLKLYYLDAGQTYLFPGRHGRGHIHPDSAAAILKTALTSIGIEGASTHSFRRTALTRLSNAGVPLRVIQEVSGHESLTQLQKYLAVSEQQVEEAIAML